MIWNRRGKSDHTNVYDDVKSVVVAICFPISLHIAATSRDVRLKIRSYEKSTKIMWCERAQDSNEGSNTGNISIAKILRFEDGKIRKISTCFVS